MIMRAYRLLQENPSPTEDEIRMGISGNLCRCTGYQNIVKAIQYAAAKLRGEALPGGRGMNDMSPRRPPSGPRSCKAWAAAASAGRTRASSRAGATTSMT